MKKIIPIELLPFMWHFSKPYRLKLSLCFLAPVLMAVETTVIPYCLGEIIDLITQFDLNRPAIFSALTLPLTLLALTQLLCVIIFRGQDLWQAKLWPQYTADVRVGLFGTISDHSHHFFADRFSGNLANKVADLVNALTALFYGIRWSFISTIAASLGALIMIGLVLPAFAALLAFWIMVHIGIALYFSKKAKMFAQNNAEDKSQLTGQIVDVFSNINNVLLFSARHREIQKLRQIQHQETHSHQALLSTMALARCAMEIPANIMLVGMITLLLHGWLNHEITGGEFALVFLSARHVLISVWMMSMQLPEIFRDVGIARQALSILQIPKTLLDAPNARALHVTQGEVHFHHVHFHYQAHKPVFEGLQLHIPAGKKVGIVGVSGSGKTSMVNLLLRLYDTTAGHVTIDGQNIKHITQDSLRENIAMIPQDTTLFHRSLMENIRYGRPTAKDTEVIQAAKNAHCHEFIMQLPDGYEAMVGERSVKLSGGQRQRIAIARAMLKNAPILVLDEATSALDSVTESFIQDSLEDLMQARTSIVIAHRLSTLCNMDRIIVLHHGQIIEDGTHDALLHKGGHYAKLWQMQVNGFLPEHLTDKTDASSTPNKAKVKKRITES
jgi:ATP-binding cassette subfamily B protein